MNNLGWHLEVFKTICIIFTWSQMHRRSFKFQWIRYFFVQILEYHTHVHFSCYFNLRWHIFVNQFRCPKPISYLIIIQSYLTKSVILSNLYRLCQSEGRSVLTYSLITSPLTTGDLTPTSKLTPQPPCSFNLGSTFMSNWNGLTNQFTEWHWRSPTLIPLVSRPPQTHKINIMFVTLTYNQTR